MTEHFLAVNKNYHRLINCKKTHFPSMAGGGLWLPFPALQRNRSILHPAAPAARCAGADPTVSSDGAAGPEI